MLLKNLCRSAVISFSTGRTCVTREIYENELRDSVLSELRTTFGGDFRTVQVVNIVKLDTIMTVKSLFQTF